MDVISIKNYLKELHKKAEELRKFANEYQRVNFEIEKCDNLLSRIEFVKELERDNILLTQVDYHSDEKGNIVIDDYEYTQRLGTRLPGCDLPKEIYEAVRKHETIKLKQHLEGFKQTISV